MTLPIDPAAVALPNTRLLDVTAAVDRARVNDSQRAADGQQTNEQNTRSHSTTGQRTLPLNGKREDKQL